MPEEIRPDILPLIHFIQTSSFAIIHFNTSPFLMNTMQLKKKKRNRNSSRRQFKMFFWIQFRIWFWIERTMIRQFWLLWRAFFFLEYIFWLLSLYTILMALNIIFGLFSSWNGRRRDRIQNLWRFLDCCKHCFSEWAKNMNSIFHPISSKSRTLVLFLLNFFFVSTFEINFALKTI